MEEQLPYTLLNYTMYTNYHLNIGRTISVYNVKIYNLCRLSPLVKIYFHDIEKTLPSIHDNILASTNEWRVIVYSKAQFVTFEKVHVYGNHIHAQMISSL